MCEVMKTTMWVSSSTAENQMTIHNNGYEKKTDSPKELVYGLKGLADFLHQSITSAWRLKKSAKFDAAISQNGRCIITDTNKLLELMRLDQQSIQGDYPFYNEPNVL